MSIKEDFVSFETAKLLKEKGFDQNCATYYLDGHVWRHYHGEVILKGKQIYAAPTQAIVMKWLRDIHGWFIHIDVIREASCWLADIQDIKNDVAIYPIKDEFPNYEEAVEAAIKYCLENLV